MQKPLEVHVCNQNQRCILSLRAEPEHFTFPSTAASPSIIWTKTKPLIPLSGLLAPATKLLSLNPFTEFMCHLGNLQTAGVTPGCAVTSARATAGLCFIPDVKGAKNWYRIWHGFLYNTVKRLLNEYYCCTNALEMNRTHNQYTTNSAWFPWPT